MTIILNIQYKYILVLKYAYAYFSYEYRLLDFLLVLYTIDRRSISKVCQSPA